MTSYAKTMQNIVETYRAAGQPWPARSKDIATWAIRERLWEFTESNAIKKCAEDLSKAMREDYETDSKGRRVRQKHPVKKQVDGKQQTFWDDINTAPHEHMELAFQQRRRSIVADCMHLKTDVDSYNDQPRTSSQIEIVFDFTFDMEELDEFGVDAA